MLKNIPINNAEILNHLNTFLTKDCIEDKLSYAKGWDGSNYDDILKYATSDDTLNNLLLDRSSYTKYSFNKIFGETEAGEYFKNTISLMLKPDRYYTSAYIPKGFVGWHADDDIAGHYIMFSYSMGDGFFKYRDPDTNTIHTFPDIHHKWMCRIGVMGKTEKDAVWHCAAAFNTRYTFIFMYDNEDNYNKAVNFLTRIID